MKSPLLLSLCLLLSSCCTNYSLYVFNLGRTVDPICYQSDKLHLYYANGQWYVKGYRCTYELYTSSMSSFPINVIPFVQLGEFDEPWQTTIDSGGNPEPVYIPIHPDSYTDVQQLLAGKVNDHPLQFDLQNYLTSLPERHRSIPTPAMKVEVLPHTTRSWGKARTSVHALWAYPLGVATAVAVDVPCSVLCTALFLPAGGCYALYSSATAPGQQQPTPPTNTTPTN